MLTLTRKTEYAMIAVCHLAKVGQKVVSARDIAEQHAVPLPLLMNVLKKLNRAGHVNSVRGARGGYVLAASPYELSLAALIEAVEGPVHLVRCTAPASDPRRCELSQRCFIRRPVVRVHDRLRKFLAGVTIADIAFDQSDIPAVDATKVLVQ
jgi:Rrf2 family protein